MAESPLLPHIVIDGTIYTEINDQVEPNVRPGQYINAVGTIYDSVTKTFRYPFESKYLEVGIVRNDGTRLNTSLHRILMLLFMHEPGCERLLVNHLDGNKRNNRLTNLEWTTAKGNVQHALAHGLRPQAKPKPEPREGHGNLTEKDVHEICEALQNGRYHGQNVELAQKYDISVSSIKEIIAGRSWANIRNQYDIEKTINNDGLSEDQVRQICEIIESFGTYNSEVHDFIIDELNLTPSYLLNRNIRRLYRRDLGCYYNITSQYSWEYVPSLNGSR